MHNVKMFSEYYSVFYRHAFLLHVSAKSPSIISPNPYSVIIKVSEHWNNFWIQRTKTKKQPPWGQGLGVNTSFLGEFQKSYLLLIFRNPTTTLSGILEKEEEDQLPKILAYLSCSAGRTHLTRTKCFPLVFCHRATTGISKIS